MHLFMTPGVLVSGSEESTQQTQLRPERPVEEPTAVWSDSLAPATTLEPVEGAAQWPRQADQIPRIAILDQEGKLHPWHASLPDDWRAESVAETDLVLMLSQPEKPHTSEIVFPSPGEHRLSAYLIEARVGKVLKSLRFVGKPLSVVGKESSETNEAVEAIPFDQVVHWVKQEIRAIVREPTS